MQQQSPAHQRGLGDRLGSVKKRILRLDKLPGLFKSKDGLVCGWHPADRIKGRQSLAKGEVALVEDG